MGLFPRRKFSRKSSGGGVSATLQGKEKKAPAASESVQSSAQHALGTRSDGVGVAGNAGGSAQPKTVVAGSSSAGIVDGVPDATRSSSSSSSSSQILRQQRNRDREQDQNHQGDGRRQSQRLGGRSAKPSSSSHGGPPSLDDVPSLLSDLRSASDPSGEVPARALRTLFALSEQSGDAVPLSREAAEAISRNRVEMVQGSSGGELIPTLLEFLDWCGRGSSEQYLCLLVLNNVSIPKENKRLIAIHHGGARALSQHLVTDPSCHLLAIILVNLSFADAELRRDLADPNTGTHIVDALSYALRMSCRRANGGEDGSEFDGGKEGGDPRKMLASLVAAEQSELASSLAEDKKAFDPADLLHPETARWCLCAIKNLTRPSSAVRDPLTILAVVESGTIPVLLRVVTVSSANDVAGWDSNSVQDAALTSLLNLASLTAVTMVKKHLVEQGAVEVLADVAEVGNKGGGTDPDDDAEKWRKFQRLKARMALSLIVGSEGHVGQQRRHPIRTNSNSRTNPRDEVEFSRNRNHPVLVLLRSEPESIINIFADVLHHRSKDGPGGYSATTFTVRGIIMAIRCLLTVDSNRVAFAEEGENAAAKLNVLLLKAISMYSLQNLSCMDAGAAEQACWSLYLMSEFGFQSPFLTVEYGPSQVQFDHHHHHPRISGGVAEKVILSYLQSDNITPAGYHAAKQLLLRMHCMVFEGACSVLGDADTSICSDIKNSHDINHATESIRVDKLRGTTPRDDIFNRPILRGLVNDASLGNPNKKVSPLSMEEIPNALRAASQLSFGSSSIRHLDSIDDIAIANNIAESADRYKHSHNGGAESYNFSWRWLDEVEEAVDEERKTARTHRSGSSRGEAMGAGSIKDFLTKITPKPLGSNYEDEPFSIFGFKCCSADVITR
uniref:Uncharacterized protein n=1 Tax=Odontella aurita TaxID=265563 RepID=A0A7S4NC32_9STRA|mmetsp:Transcript_57170/g.170415  ORF Transcript_57170/g.170415 Transcript_57170/m.170415 type:complete len:897 (+) Transcript_57170:594-3284(+)